MANRPQAESDPILLTWREKWRDHFETWTEWPLLVLVVAIIPLVLYPFNQTAIDAIFVAISIVFTLDLGVRAFLADDWLRYLGQNWLEVVVVVVAGLASAFTIAAAAGLADSIPEVKLAGVARSARAVRILRLTRSVPFLARAWNSAAALLERGGLQYVLVAFLVVMFTSAGAIVLLEGNDGEFDGYWRGLYWAIANITTGGGATSPESSGGKALEALLMFVGITFSAWFTANVAAFLVEHGGVTNTGVTLEEVMDKLNSMESRIDKPQADHNAAQENQS